MSEHTCQKEKLFEELFKRTNDQDKRLVATEVKMQMLLWASALIVGLVITNIVVTLTNNQQKVAEMYQSYQQSRQQPK